MMLLTTPPGLRLSAPSAFAFLRPALMILCVVAMLAVPATRVHSAPLSVDEAIGNSIEQINYQGYLTDSSGTAISGSVNMVFSIFDASSNGTRVWGPETHTGVQVRDGVFSVLLGSKGTGITASFLDDGAWLEIKVNGETLAPRDKLAAVPYAVLASQALTVPDGAISTSKLNIDSYLPMNENAVYQGIVWPPSYGGRGSMTAIPAFYDTLYYAMRRGFNVTVNRPDNWGTFEDIFDLNGAKRVDWYSVSTSNPVQILIEYPSSYGTGPNLTGFLVAFAWRYSYAVDYTVEYYHDADNNGTYIWETIANVTGNSRDEIYHQVRMWRVKKIRFTVTKAGAEDQPNILRIATIQAYSPLFGKATGQMLDVGGDKMFGNLNMNGYTINNVGAVVEANLQTPEELAADSIDRFGEGDLLCWAGDALEKCAVANSRAVQAVASVEGKPIVIGAERVKVIGPVRVNDLLVASDEPGYAMVNNDAATGTVIAQALQDFEGERGLIKAMIRKY